MPVSTFSSGTTAIRSHGSLIERWNSTRDRIREDERRVSRRQINEMDGTGLYERDNWPLAEHEGVSPQQEDATPMGNSEERLGRVVSAAVMRKTEDILSPLDFPEREVSDIDEDEVREPLEESDFSRTMNESSQRPMQTDGPESSFNSRQQPYSEDEDAQPSPTLGSSTFVDPLAVSEGPPVQRTTQSPPFRNFSSPTRAEFGGHNLERTVSPVTDVSDGGQHTSSGEVHLDEDSHEARDVATPIPFEAETTHPTNSPSTPRVNQSVPMTNGHGRASSILKGTPPARSSSLASSNTPMTTHKPQNPDRVRYSWQSLQDDEPNRPRIHIIKLVSEVATASAGFPGGEAFGFSISPGGRRIAVYNSARLYVLQTAALPVGISQDYALKRRPLAVEILDEGHILAILADAHTINIYDLGHRQLKRVRTIKTDFPTNCIALAPSGGLLAAAYEGGVEVYSLAAGALPTDRRAVRSVKMDRLAFSEDGSTLLGTTTRINISSTVIVSVPIFPAASNGIPTHDELKEAWCSELLHPENIRNSSHAIFMREARSTCNDRLFAWNGLADTFGILNISDMQYGNLDFPVVISPPLSTCGGLGAAIHSCPAIDEHGDTVAMIVNDRTIRLYIVPHKLEDDETTVEAHSIDHELDEGYGCPFSEVRWVHSSASLPAPLSNQTQVQGRLLVTSPGGVSDSGMGMTEESLDDIEGGRIILFDFDPQFAGQPGQTFSLTLGKSPSQVLEEPEPDHAEEVALARKRTVNQSKNGGLSQRPGTLGRAATTVNRDRVPRSASPGNSINASRRSMMSINTMQSEAARSLPDLLEASESGEVLEEPYVQGAPRSGLSLQRAATNAQRHRFQALEERNQERISVDSNGNFLPLPEYTEEPNAPLPSRFRAMAGLDAPPQPPPKPAVVTSNGPGQVPPTDGPATAPASMSESFSREDAFRTAASTAATTYSQQQASGSARPLSPASGSDTLSSTRPMPRGLQRAYSNAVSPLGSGPAPSLIGDWENVSPIGQNSTNASWMPIRSGTAMSERPPSSARRSQVPDEDNISPVASQNHPASPFGRAPSAAGQRYSRQLLSPVGHRDSRLQRAPSAASSSMVRSTSSAGDRLPQHMQAFRNAAASPSLFPPAHPSDQLAVRESGPKAGSVAHPITGWHPPAPSAAASPPRSPHGTGHARKNSLTSRSAFASTERAKKLGFFKRRDKSRPLLPGGYPSETGEGGESVMETKSMVTWMSKSDNKCLVM
ncbi:hypothetical protein KC363_g4325 [Hortaea werneckii]|uniref:DUF7165 domain-containing protein n=1 Tax=Hortaea werneckii TaxID=91943 RepID=A0A3M7FIM0_HORWE|nr:hypothetical protein KC325_g4074 [Hortaea werneckii]KAI6994802.1 hypothetical protein KC359_g4402 [Hortaea werneckii]KAI7146047.1 hypothetical protein KC344_g4021 [Hortaea werneckii]KAI7166983.1 hypothetical protein KC360_g8915 [Hortaea werneckii]KAI7190555.1 hypothetical protein KC363_g4325 [Hortaea werneckii]